MLLCLDYIILMTIQTEPAVVNLDKLKKANLYNEGLDKAAPSDNRSFVFGKYFVVRFIFDKICNATIIYLEDLCSTFDEYEYEDKNGKYVCITKIDKEIFEDCAKSNDYDEICHQLDYLIDQIDDTIIIPEINYEIVYTFYNYDMFDFGAYEKGGMI